ncbi:MAG: hypothetical protein GQ535_12225 [Rhodobacteraceae bacterium]|nr:hypothetical protein [Paracoccaceae bacterium]
MKSVLQTLRSTDWIKDCSDEIPDIATAYDIQSRAMAEIAKERGGFAGYKIAFNSAALLQKLKIKHPAVGRILADQVFESHVKIDAAQYRNFMIEPEIAAVLGEDIVAGEHVTIERAEAAVSRYFPAFELLDRRNFEGMMHVPTVVAHNVFNAGIVCGGPGVTPADFDWKNAETQCSDNGDTVVQGFGTAPQNPAEAVAFIANHFIARGQNLPKGSLLLLGAHCPLYKVEAGREMRLSIGALGEVSFST